MIRDDYEDEPYEEHPPDLQFEQDGDYAGEFDYLKEDPMEDRAAVHAAEESVIGQYTSTHRSTVEEMWGYEDDELGKIQYNANGYLACGIASSRIIEHDPETGIWIIEVTPDIGPPIDPERYRVYRATAGDEAWIVEAE